MFFFFRKSRQRLTETILDRRGLFTLPHCSLQIDLITGQHIFPNSTVWLTIFELPHDDVRVVVLFGKSFFDTKKDTQKSLEERNSTYHTTTIVHYHRMRMGVIIPLWCHSENSSFSRYFTLKLTLLIILLSS